VEFTSVRHAKAESIYKRLRWIWN